MALISFPSPLYLRRPQRMVATNYGFGDSGSNCFGDTFAARLVMDDDNDSRRGGGWQKHRKLHSLSIKISLERSPKYCEFSIHGLVRKCQRLNSRTDWEAKSVWWNTARIQQAIKITCCSSAMAILETRKAHKLWD